MTILLICLQKLSVPFFEKVIFWYIFGGGITGGVQVNDTTYHSESKAAYRKKEMQLMLDLTTEHPDEIPAPSRGQMMRMFNDAWDEVYDKTDCEDVYKKNMTLAFDGPEDHLASKKIMDFVGKENDSI